MISNELPAPVFVAPVEDMNTSSAYSQKALAITACLYIALLLVNINPVIGQTTSLRVEANIGTFVMTDPKEFQDGLPSALLGKDYKSIPYKVYGNFSPTPGYDVVLTFPVGPTEWNILGGYNSTGSRLHYRDYSGEIKVDQVVSNMHFALDYSVVTLPGQYGIVFKPSIAAGIAFSDHKLESLFVLQGLPTDTYNDHLASKQWFALPSCKMEYQVSRFLLMARVGYHIQINFNDDFRPNWSGVRAGAGVGIILKKGQEKSTNQG
ncbi:MULTISPECIES: hypothetical protein [unclassified Imperialibacter]|uniref:hypothetical protein n=1 Tax=unclassified Imperialibacter TaxID=2629706 RepID=UPI001254F88B|nr:MULTISPECIES: hypothetical protein [unclassified Imperialibacter]CAD5265081.1 hypothetical protein IMPERIA89_300073 [Imperialibacter sp. 89]CAD5269971.1 hypothetical protein IMPERIA75_360074 [Imperialibacter sp. 75]VVT09567.1 hypothetical protein IMPR6_180075 [Imperialibacter sp. EC-SDR9]